MFVFLPKVSYVSLYLQRITLEIIKFVFHNFLSTITTNDDFKYYV